MYGTFSAKIFPQRTLCTMKKDGQRKTGQSLSMRSIFRCMMEGGYYPVYEKTHVVFELDGNLAIVEYEEGILSVRIFFSIEKEWYSRFLKAGNNTMMKAFMVKPVVMNDLKNLMFSCEMFCDNVREFRKFFPRSIEILREAMHLHRIEMTIPATDEFSSMTGTAKNHKITS